MLRGRAYWLRLLQRSLVQRRGRVLVSLLTIALGTSVVAAFVTLHSDVEAKMSRELRAYGANFVVRPADVEGALRPDARTAVAAVVPPERLMGVQALLYDAVSVEGERLTAAGLDFARIGATTPYWQITVGWVAEGGTTCLLGREAAARLRAEPGARLELRHGARRLDCRVAGLVETGGAEDGQIFLPLDEASTLFAREGEIDLVLASLVADAAEAESFARVLERRLPGARAQTIHKLARAEGLLLRKLRSLMAMAVAIILLSTFVGLWISLMAAAAQRRKEVALWKALGATDGRVAAYFLAEISAIGLAGGLFGALAGHGLAHLMEQALFGTTVAFNPVLVPPVLAVALAVSMAGAVVPVRRMMAVPPAVVLKGER